MACIAITQAVRPVLFYTGIDEFRYATHGGTAFVVSYKDRPYAVTCRHAFKDFDEGQLTLFGARSLRRVTSPQKSEELTIRRHRERLRSIAMSPTFA